MIPFVNPGLQYEKLREEILERFDRVSLTGNYVLGVELKDFEKNFANFCGTKFAIGVGNGSDALTFSLLGLGVKPGDEVITAPNSFVSSAWTIANIGAKPVFVDVGDDFNINPKLIQNAITQKTKAIMPVHLLGNTANMLKIQDIAERHNLFVIEDSCEAHGAEFNGKKIGSFGNMSTFSFFLSHHITTIEGGILLTDNDELYELGKSLRAFGWIRDLDNKDEIKNKFPHIDPRFLFLNMGFNMRPTEIQGAFGIHQIGKLEKFIQIRTENAQFWNKKLDKYTSYIQLPKELPNSRHAYFGYSILIKNDAPFSYKQFGEFLESKNIEVRPIMAGNIVEQPSSQLYEYKVSSNLTNSTYIMKNGLFLPNHHMIGTSERQYILDTITEFIEKRIWENN